MIKLKEYVQQNGTTSAVVDIPSWLARTTLDAIGIGGIKYYNVTKTMFIVIQRHLIMSLEHSKKALTINSLKYIRIYCSFLLYSVGGECSYLSFSADVFLDRSDAFIAFGAILGKIPLWLVTVLQRLPTKRLQRLQNYMKTAREVAQTLVNRQTALHAAGKNEAKDVMSILSKYVSHNTRFKHRLSRPSVRANLSEDPKTRLGNEEILGQLT